MATAGGEQLLAFRLATSRQTVFGPPSVFQRVLDSFMTGLLARVYGLPVQDAYILSTMVGSVRIAGCLASKRWADWRVQVGLSVPKDFDFQGRS